MKILLVEDDEGTRVTLGYALSQGGLEVHTASSSPEAERMLAETRFDWMVTDGDLEPEDGFALAEKAARSQPRLRIVMISGVYGAEDILGFPIETLFQKPVDASTLLDYLQHSGVGGRKR